MSTDKKNLIVRISTFVLLLSVMATLVCLTAFAVPDDEYEQTSATSIATSHASSSSVVPSSTATSTPASSKAASSKAASTATSAPASSKAASSSSESSKAASSKQNTSGVLFDNTDDGIDDNPWGTDYTDASSEESSTVSEESSNAKKSIADYYDAMKRLVWIPILLIVLSVATLLFVNITAHKNLKKGRRQVKTDRRDYSEPDERIERRNRSGRHSRRRPRR